LKFTYQAVERLPKQLQSGIIYHSEEFEVAVLLCACGCGHRVTLLVPDSHQVTSEGELATVHPSISVCDASCKSHYVISGGRVEWYPAFSEVEASIVMRNQIARHANIETKQFTWTGRIRAALSKVYNKIKSILRV
jgi:hypothetical protein